MISDINLHHLAILVRQCRGNRSYRQAAVGITPSFLHRVENEVGAPSLEGIFWLANWMGLRPGRLIEQITVVRSDDG